ncbi:MULTISPECIES: YgiT-type zinc finger protein [Nostocales]|jgi:YgiT-type zinc finger domain-containing protein|uniref:YgiT-type zinc finger protein n=1 Tax=Dolichospermum flos-aquae UHCC 0037 TaxID=2590026 RepID=A0ACC7S0B9_DOLFA|nr:MULTISPECIES: YgiT-type zinc finger protein [Nostocales]MBO1065902.1 YgiT-type zinc finger protein [Anabaena sp. 54]MTJ41744.1 YgiT-type zinc finger protein [Dolichospermum flos-aquae UHCC 0037]
MKTQKCPTCQGELETKQIEKMLKGGNNTAVIHVEAEVCSKCGEKLYKPDVVNQFTQIRAKLRNQETKDFQVIGQSFRVSV